MLTYVINVVIAIFIAEVLALIYSKKIFSINGLMNNRIVSKE